jgi:hypothetical protein
VTVCILKHCKVRVDDAVQTLVPGDFLTVATGKEARLIETGHARAAVAQDYRSMANDFRTRDPCGDCWSWTQRNQPALWRKHLKALQADNIAAARLTYNQMTAAWSAAQQQPA